MYCNTAKKIVTHVSKLIFMKINMIVGFILISHVSSGQNFDFKLYLKNFEKINDTLYVMKYEVTNEMYNIFLTNSELNNKAFFIDTLKWLQMQDSFDYKVMAEFYHSHLEYKDFPVVNITREGAMAFCEWLTKIYIDLYPDQKQKVVFRLPTEKEWMWAARGGKEENKYGWNTNEPYDAKRKKLYGCYRLNYKEAADVELSKSRFGDGNFATKPVDSYSPNRLGLYCMSGNVSEMVEEEGFVKGGDWFHDLNYCEVGARLPWDEKAAAYVGFRVAMVVKKK